jgi:hypothetical protein
MAMDNIHFQPPHPLYNKAQNKVHLQLYPIYKAINDELILGNMREFLVSHKISYLDQIVSNDGLSTRSWHEVMKLYPRETKGKNNSSGPAISQSLIRTIIPQEIDAVATTISSYPVDPSAGIGKWVTIWGVNPCFDENLARRIAPLRSSGRQTTSNLVEYSHAPAADGYKLKIDRDSMVELAQITPLVKPPAARKSITTARKHLFLGRVQEEGSILAIFTDGSAIHRNSTKARARPGIFMARKQDILLFVESKKIAENCFAQLTQN